MKRAAILFLRAILPMVCAFATARAADADTFSPVVSYQYLDSLAESGTATTVSSPVVSYQYFDWLGDENLTFQSSPAVSYLFQQQEALSVTPDKGTSFGLLLPGRTSDRTFTLKNSSSAAIAGTITVGAPFTLVGGNDSYALAAGQSTTVTVRFSPTVPGNYTTYLTFSSGLSWLLTASVFADFNLAGRVVEAGTGAAIGGATVTLGDRTATTQATTGVFHFANITGVPGDSVTVAKAGYVSTQRTLTPANGARSIEMGDIALGRTGAAPEVVAVIPQYNGLFLEGVSLTNRFDAEVNWNGSTPKLVEWRINGVLQTTTTTTDGKAAVTFNMATDFQPRVGQPNRLEAIAVAVDGKRSRGLAVPVRVLPVPDFLQGAVGLLPAGTLDETSVISFEFSPDDASPVSRQLPFLGKFGGDFDASFEVEYALASGEWEVHAGLGSEKKFRGRPGERPHSSVLNPKWYLGNCSLEFGISAVGAGVASLEQGFFVSDLGTDLTLDYRGEVMTFYLSDYVPGTQWLRVLDVAKRFGIDPNGLQRVRLDALVGAEFSLLGKFDPPPFHYGETTFGLTAGLEAIYEPNLKVVRITITAGGEVGATLQWPAGEPVRLKEVTGKIYGAVEAKVKFIGEYKAEFALLDYTWTQAASATHPAMRALSSFPVIQVDGRKYVSIPISESKGPSPVERPNLARGSEVFVGGAAGASVVRGRASQNPSARRLTAPKGFRQMGSGGIPGAVGRVMPATRGESDPAGSNQSPGAVAQAGVVAPAQADLPLVTNAYAAAEPALAGKGSELMLLYVRDDGGADLQFTDIAWTRFDGTDWSPPAAIATDTRGEFAPQVRFDGNGDAIAVWERVKDPAFSSVDVAALAAQLEIVWARWDRGTGQWTAPAALTDNAHLDHRPLLCGPMSNGDVLLVWTANEADQFVGSGAAGAPANTKYMTAQWSAATKIWVGSTILLADVTGEMSPALDGQDNRAVLVWGRDLDGDVTTAEDSELFYSNWQSGNWGPVVQFTDNAEADVNVRVAVSASGDCHLVWRAGSDLQWSANFAAPVLARAAADTTGFADYALTVGPGGNVVLLWQEKSDDGSDAYYRTYDPASTSWGKDDRLTADAPLEHSFAPVWDAAGNLTTAYLKVQVGKTTKSVTLADGSRLTIDNVPESGQADLVVTKRALVRDAAILPGDFVVKGGNLLPGDALTLKAAVRNSGNLALENLKVAFYNGDPAAGGTKIGEVISSGWLRAAASTEASVDWVLPTTTTAVHLFAVVDPNGTITENREDNNQQSIGVGGTDLVTRYLSSTVATDGSMRIVAEVQNIGMPASPSTSLAVMRTGASTVITQMPVPALEPGEIAQIGLDLPAGAHPVGETGFVLEVDSGGEMADTNLFNNRAEFASNRWLAPVIVSQPVAAQSVAAGDNVTFRVTAGGTGPFTYQWYKNGVAIAGATSAMLTLNNVQAGDAGNYSVVITNNSSDSVTSNAGTLSVLAAGNTAGHVLVGRGYVPGGTVTISNRLTFTDALSEVAWQVLLPADWSLASDTGTTGATRPAAGTTALLEWTWAAAPASPLVFTYTLNVPPHLDGPAEIVALAVLEREAVSDQMLAQPDPLTIGPAAPLHSADTNHDSQLSLTELLRVIELYNTRYGTVRTGAYVVDANNLEDGFGTDPARSNTAVVTLTRYHSGDSNHDGKLSLTELLRVIELYNTRDGTVRTGQYHVQAGTEDGFAAGP